MKTTMKCLTLLLAITSYSLFGQTTVDRFKDFEIKNTSSKILTGIKLDLNQNYAASINSLRRAELEKFDGAKVNEYVPVYLDSFNETLKKTKESHAREEFLWKTGNEVMKYGLDVMGNYAQSSPFKFATGFVVPAIQRGFGLYVDKRVNDLIKANRATLDGIITDKINLLYSNGVDVTTAQDYQSFENLFTLAQADLPAMDREDYPVVNKQLLKYAYKFIADNRDQIQLLDLRVTNQYEQLKNSFDARFDAFRQDIESSTKERFDEVGKSIADLTQNQFEIFNTLEGIETRISSNQTRITQIEGQMAQVQNDVDALAALQKEHSVLIGKNAFQISILTNYAFQNLSTEQKIKGLEDEHFDNIFNDAEKTTLIAELKEIQTKETIISVSNDIAQYSGKTYEFLVNTGVLKGNDAKVAGELIHAINLGTGVARMYAGDASGLFSAMSGMSGLMGSKPQKSPEMEMLEYMMEVMNQRFDRIEEKLDVIESRIQHLTEVTVDMYESMMNSFQILNGELERINWKLDNLQEMTRLQLFNEYNTCGTLKNAIEQAGIEFNSYSDYLDFYTANSGICLGALNDFSITNELGFFYFSTNNTFLNQPAIEYEIGQIYEPVRDLFLQHYSGNQNLASNALMFPTREIRYSYKPLMILNNLDELQNIATGDAFNNYFNYEMITQFAELFLTFNGYFEISGNGAGFAPLSLNQYLSKTAQQRALKRALQVQRINKLLRVTDYAIMQQALLAGNELIDPIYSILFSANQSQADKDLVKTILTKNSLLAANFSANLVRKNLNAADLSQYVELYGTDMDDLSALNNLILYNQFSFTRNQQGKIEITIGTGDNAIKINAPDPHMVVSNEMKNTSALYTLLETRKKLNNELIDISFTRNLPQNGDVSSKEFKYLFMEEQKPIIIGN